MFRPVSIPTEYWLSRHNILENISIFQGKIGAKIDFFLQILPRVDRAFCSPPPELGGSGGANLLAPGSGEGLGGESPQNFTCVGGGEMS